VALQGTLDTFALPDVLRLLASTKKVGRLRVTGDTGSGSLWVEGGTVVGSELLVRGVHADSLTESLFNMLRFSHGSFTFEAGSVPPSNGQQLDVENIIVEAELMLGEWRALEQVVPSLDAWLSLAQELKGRDVVIDSGRWRIVVTIGSGATVAEVGRRTGLAELAVMRAVKEVVELGLVEVNVAAPADTDARFEIAPFDEAPVVVTAPPAPPVAVIAPNPLPPVFDAPVFDAPAFDAPAFDAPAFRAPVVDEAPEPIDEPATFVSDRITFAPVGEIGDAPATDVPVFANDTPLAPPSITEMRNGLGAMHLSDEPARRPTYDSPLDDPSEIARQLANLSPRAAKAVAAAAKATTDEERDAALAAIEAEDETINRGLLLKFLGAVDG
jgi:Domain of unknown function (DUF4388)